MSIDPLETLNRYAYVSGNVVNRVDPWGLCDWNDFDQIKALIPKMYEVAQSWNRILLSKNELAPYLDVNGKPTPCGAVQISQRMHNTGFTDTAFVALMAAHVHQEGRLGGFLGLGTRPDRLPSNIGGDLLDKLGMNFSLGIANITPSVAREILNGIIPSSVGIINFVVGDRLKDVRKGLEDIDLEVINLASSGQGNADLLVNLQEQVKLFSDTSIALELLGANTNRGIIRIQRLGSTPTIFNMGTWFLGGIQPPNEFEGAKPDKIRAAAAHGNHLITHMLTIVSRECDLGLRWSGNPSGEFSFFNSVDAPYVDPTLIPQVSEYQNATSAPYPY